MIHIARDHRWFIHAVDQNGDAAIVNHSQHSQQPIHHGEARIVAAVNGHACRTNIHFYVMQTFTKARGRAIDASDSLVHSAGNDAHTSLAAKPRPTHDKGTRGQQHSNRKQRAFGFLHQTHPGKNQRETS